MNARVRISVSSGRPATLGEAAQPARPFYTRHLVGIAAAAFVVAALLLTGEMDYQDEIHAAKLYCTGVALYQSTDGRQGHPDYKRIAADHCPVRGES